MPVSRVCCYWRWHCVPSRRPGQFQSLGVWSKVFSCNVNALDMVKRGHLSLKISEILFFHLNPHSHGAAWTSLLSRLPHFFDRQRNWGSAKPCDLSRTQAELRTHPFVSVEYWTAFPTYSLLQQCQQNARLFKENAYDDRTMGGVWAGVFSSVWAAKAPAVIRTPFSRLNANPAHGYHVWIQALPWYTCGRHKHWPNCPA